MHWTDRFSSAGPIDRLVGAATDPISGQPELKATPVRVTPVAALWRGLVLRHSEILPDGPYYWARVPLDDGHAFDLAGWAPLPSGNGTATWVAQLLDAPASPELVIYADPRRGAFRYASLVDGRLDACLFVARNAASLPPRETVASLLGAAIEPDMRTCLLAGQGLGPAANEAGRTICACFGIGLRTLHDTIASRRLTSVAEIGDALRAGTNCGSCLPELKAILHDAAIARSTAA
jgi:assimilatory nitrate reductase catalytic subunit